MKKELTPDDAIEQSIIRFLNGTSLPGEADELVRWIEASSGNRNIYNAYKEIWAGSSVTFPDQKFNPQKGWERIRPVIKSRSHRHAYQDTRKTRRIYLKFARIAALYLALMAFGATLSGLFIFNYFNFFSDQVSTIEAPQGARSMITLPDNSTVWLNAGSEISYSQDFNKSERVVKLQGEAFFDVSTNPQKPFVVETPNLSIKALGTSFNVKAYPNEDAVLATLVEGKAIIEVKGINENTISYPLEPRQNFTYLKSDRSISRTDQIVEDAGDEVATVTELSEPELPAEPESRLFVRSNIRPELYTSWKDSEWIIEGESLATLAVLLERKYNTEINIRSEELKRYKFTGNIMNETLEQVLEIVRMTAPLSYTVGKGTVEWQLDADLKEKIDIILQSN